MSEDAFESMLARARAGDPAAREELARVMAVETHLLAHRELGHRLRRKMESVDVSQSAVAQALGNLERFQGTTQGELARWLSKHVLNHIRDSADHYKAKKRDLGRERRLATAMPVRAAVGRAEPRSPSSLAAEQERAAKLMEAVRRLPDPERVLIELYHRGETWEQVAETLDLPSPGAARKRCARILQRLAKELKPLREDV